MKDILQTGDIMVDVNTIILYILLGAVFGIVYSLRRMYIVEEKIDALERLMASKLLRSSSSKKKRRK